MPVNFSLTHPSRFLCVQCGMVLDVGSTDLRYKTCNFHPMRGAQLILCSVLVGGHIAASNGEDDPTRPYPEFRKEGSATAAATANVKTRWVLESVMIFGNARYATINGARVTVGEHIKDAKVVRIEPDRVVLSQDTGFTSLTLAAPAKTWITHARD